MIFFLATNRVRPEMIETYEQAIRDMAAQVKATEPGLLVYEVARSPDASGTYKGLEIYVDEAALMQHIEGVVRPWLPILYDCFECAPVVECFTDLV